MGLREIDDLVAIGTPVDQIAEKDQLIVFRQLEPFEEIREFLMATVDIADGNDTSVHSGCRKLTSLAGEDK